jgi:hypothetical protein
MRLANGATKNDTWFVERALLCCNGLLSERCFAVNFRCRPMKSETMMMYPTLVGVTIIFP